MSFSLICCEFKHTRGDLGSDKGRTAQMKPPPFRILIVDEDLRDFRPAIRLTGRVVLSPVRP